MVAHGQQLHLDILAGKLLPHTAVFFLMGILYNTYLYGFLHFPCNSGILPMLLATLCLVLASQGMGILMIGTLPTLRLGLSFASYGAYCRSPCADCHFPPWRCIPYCKVGKPVSPAPLLPYLRRPGPERLSHDLLVDELWALLVFMMLPFLVARRLKKH